MFRSAENYYSNRLIQICIDINEYLQVFKVKVLIHF